MELHGIRLTRADLRRDRLAMAGATAGILSVVFVLGSIHNGLLASLTSDASLASMLHRVLAGVIGTGLMVLFNIVFGVERATTVWTAMQSVLPAAFLASVARAEVLFFLNVRPAEDLAVWASEFAGGALFCMAGGLLAFLYMRSQRLLRIEERHAAVVEVQRELALRTLEEEEVRVRRSIAEGLHGSLQQRLVIQAVRIDLMIAEARKRGHDDDAVGPLVALRDDIEEIREHDVREMSRMLYPEGLELGVVPALRSLLRRLPPGIGTALEVSDAARVVDDPVSSVITSPDRLLAVRVVEEAITNALRHGRATRVVVRVDHDGEALTLTVANNGRPLPADAAERRSGTQRIDERLALVGGSIELVSPPPLSADGADDFVPTPETSVELRARIPLTVARDADADELVGL